MWKKIIQYFNFIFFLKPINSQVSVRYYTACQSNNIHKYCSCMLQAWMACMTATYNVSNEIPGYSSLFLCFKFSAFFSQDSFIWDFLLYLEDNLTSNFISICTPVLHRELVDRYGISISQIMAIDIFLYIHFFFPPSLTILLPDFTMTD